MCQWNWWKAKSMNWGGKNTLYGMVSSNRSTKSSSGFTTSMKRWGMGSAGVLGFSLLCDWGCQFLSPLSCALLSSPQTVQTINITNDEPPFIFTDQMLSPSAKYRGRMRAMVNNQDYQGYWSEWSEEFIWETENGTFQAGSFCQALCTLIGLNASRETDIHSRDRCCR